MIRYNKIILAKVTFYTVFNHQNKIMKPKLNKSIEY